MIEHGGGKAQAGRKSVCAVLLAAGSSTRMGENKLLMRFCGKTPIEHCVDAFSGLVDEFVIAVSEDTRSAALEAAENAGARVKLVSGGERRQDSVQNALVSSEADIVAVHDCARCLVSKEIISSSIEAAMKYGCGIASRKVTDTLRLKETGEVVDREALLAAQTPQSFLRRELIKAYGLIREGEDFTDDAAVFAAAGNRLYYSMGSAANIKLTGRDDVPLVKAILENKKDMTNMKANASAFRIGFGEDTHRLVEGRRLVLGGVQIPFEYGLDGHSDADALTHALIDALLGACALSDIGAHFPDSDMRYKDISSLRLAAYTAELIKKKGFSIGNLDATVIAQRPKLSQYRDAMRFELARAFGIDAGAVSVKFTTPEHTGPEGRGESMTVRATALVYSD